MQYKSGYIANQAKLAEESKAGPRQSRLDAAITRIGESGPLPPVEYMQIIGSHDKEHFMTNMKFFANEIVTRCRATPSSSFLDIGCGCGRLALPLSEYIDASGRLVGVDVWQEGIDWCSRNIRGSGKNTAFHCLPAADNYYFTEESRAKNDFRLRFLENESVDIAFAISVFTHLKKSDTLAYLRELGRTLRPNGVAYVTCFIIDHFFYDYVAATGNHTAVKESPEDRGCFYAYSRQDFFSGFTMEAWNSLVAESGLWAICHETGQWADKPGSRLYQDTFVLGRLR